MQQADRGEIGIFKPGWRVHAGGMQANRSFRIVSLFLVLGVSACDPRVLSPSATPAPTPTPAPPAVGSAATQAAPANNAGIDAGSGPEAPAAPVAVEAAVNVSPESAENRMVKAEVLDRIDVMPKLTDEEKDKLYVQVERARGMGKLLTIPFKSGKRALSKADVAVLKNALAAPQFEKFVGDPTVVFVVLGFADKAGDPATNLSLSRVRADAVVDVLKDECGVLNVTHSVGMGSSEMFDAANLDKNRVVEIWAVLP